MNRFLNWIICAVILVLMKADFSESERRKILGMDISEVGDVWKNNIKILNQLLKVYSKDALEKGESFPEEELQYLKQLMKLYLVLNKEMECEVHALINEPPSSMETSHEFQYWQNTMKKAIERVYEKISELIENAGMEPLDPSSVEKMANELDNNLDKALGLTLLLRNSKHTFEDRAVQSLSNMFKFFDED